MFKIKTLTVKNFMSVGNATQAIDFNRRDLTLVLGENLDLGGDDSGSRNGTGKTTIINALSYALYGSSLTNIKKDNLINKTNNKNMLVTVDFDKDGINYKIERGRKPNILKFYIGSVEQETIDDNSQGDNRETQQEIEHLLGLSHDMFRHIVALNTYTEPFLSLRAGDQRTIIEQLLGITVLSEKSNALREQNKTIKDSIQSEEYKIKSLQDANKRIEEQIENLKRRQTLWIKKHKDDAEELQSELSKLMKIDISEEIAAHKALVTYTQTEKDIADLKKAISRSEQDLAREQKNFDKLVKEISDLESHTCYACGQEFHDEKHESVLSSKKQDLEDTISNKKTIQLQLKEFQEVLELIGNLGSKPSVFYKEEEHAIHHRSTVASLQHQLDLKLSEIDPYLEQIDDMTNTALAEIDYTVINELTRLKDHQDFLLKLLTNKDSFIRKRMIDQNLNYLNSRLGYYLNKIGLPHTIKFQNDLSVEIQELGRELDFDNLSRGERNRLILSLSWAFRDVWENLFQPINLLFIDELVDSGMDTSGVESSLAILKKMARDQHKSIWLVSHKDELTGRVNNLMTVVKENGFTAYNTDVEIY